MLAPLPPRAIDNVPAHVNVCVLLLELIVTFVSLAKIWVPLVWPFNEVRAKLFAATHVGAPAPLDCKIEFAVPAANIAIAVVLVPYMIPPAAPVTLAPVPPRARDNVPAHVNVCVLLLELIVMFVSFAKICVVLD